MYQDATLATVLANITADRYLLSLLRPLLVTRYPGLPAVYTWENRLQALLEKEHLPNGSWVPVSQLPTSTRQAIDAACSQLVQELSPIASIADAERTSPVLLRTNSRLSDLSAVVMSVPS